MSKRIVVRFGIALLWLFTPCLFAGTGLFWNLSPSGIPADVNITLCLNAKGPVSCQNYTTTALTLNLSTNIPNHTYPYAGIKVNTPGYKLANTNCTPIDNGYCLFAVSNTAATTLTLSPLSTIAVQANLSSAFNLIGIYTNGSTYSSNGGMDRSGTSYSETLLGTSQTFNGVTMDIGPSNVLDTVSGSGQTIPLPNGNFATLNMLAAGVNGDQLAQQFIVTYTDNSTTTVTQSLSDWAVLTNYPGQTIAVTMAYANTYTGGTQGTHYLFGYTFSLDSQKTVRSITLPNNDNVVVLSITLVT